MTIDPQAVLHNNPDENNQELSLTSTADPLFDSLQVFDSLQDGDDETCTRPGCGRTFTPNTQRVVVRGKPLVDKSGECVRSGCFVMVHESGWLRSLPVCRPCQKKTKDGIRESHGYEAARKLYFVSRADAENLLAEEAMKEEQRTFNSALFDALNKRVSKNERRDNDRLHRKGDHDRRRDR